MIGLLVRYLPLSKLHYDCVLASRQCKISLASIYRTIHSVTLPFALGPRCFYTAVPRSMLLCGLGVCTEHLNDFFFTTT